ncbi:MAG: secretin N-terminal domain-containing protein [Pirellulales bacterium]
MTYAFATRPLLPLLFLSAIAWSPAPCRGQEQPAKERSETILEVIRLNHTPADNVLQTLKIVLKDSGEDMRIASDPTSNSILISARADRVQSAKEIISRMDVPQPDQEVKIFSLQHIEAKEAIQMLARMVNQAYAVPDPNANRLLVRGKASDLATVEALLQAIDIAPSPVADDVRLRLVWLVADLPHEEAPAAPPDLDEVVRELEKHGIENLKVATQTIIKLSRKPRSDFSAQGTTRLVEPCQLQVNGRVAGSEGEALTLSISIDARNRADGGRGGGQSADWLCHLSSELTLTPGHSVVLGVTPTNSMTSVFVVQLLEAQAAKPAADKPAADKPAADKPAADKPSAGKAAAEPKGR